MANLTLPALLSRSDISALHMRLARALSQYYKLNLDDAHVVKSLADSGMVVEAGKEINW